MKVWSLRYLWVYCLVGVSLATYASAQERPNVLFLAVDDMKD